jgi:putative nucleotidyltransferase with HDIG domain
MDLHEPERNRILFVDDEDKVLDGLRRMLYSMRKDWDMVFVPGGQEALDALKLEPFDVIVTDMRMPGMNGAELLAEVVKLYPESVRIVLSGQWDQQMTIQSARNAHQYLTKPCSAESLKATLERIFTLRRMLAGRSLKRLVSGLTTLPSLPGVYEELVRALESPDITTDQIGAVIARDMAMTAKVLQLANSAFFGLSRRISSAAEAVLYVGLDTIKALVLTVGVFSQFRGKEPNALSLAALQRHSLETARIARSIARAEATGKRILDDAFLAALLHDVGKLILVNKDAEMYDQVLTIVGTEKVNLDAVEREVFGATHAEVGSYLLWLWGLPSPVIEAVMFHHTPAECPVREMSGVALVHLADALAHELHGDRIAGHLDEPYLASAGFTDRLPEWREIARGALDAGEER